MLLLWEAQNLILFEKMAKKMIDGDFESFREATSLLTTWLSKRQAYYPNALVQIVRLLFIALLRVRSEVKFDDASPLLFKAQQYSENPFAVAYIDLVNAILPFQDVFLEGDKGLREGYQQLITSVSSLPEQGTPQILSPTPQPTNIEPASTVVPPTPISEATSTRQVPSVTGPGPVLESPNERIELEASKSAETRSPAPTSSVPEIAESSRAPSSSESKDNTILVNLEAGEQPILTLTDPQPAHASDFPEQLGITTLDSETPDVALPAKYDDMEKQSHTSQGQQPSNESVDQPREIPRSPLTSDPGASLLRSDISTHLVQGLHNESLTGTAGVTEVSTPVSGTFSTEQNLPLQFMEIDSVEAQKPWNEPIASVQDLPHSLDNTLASMEINAPSRGESDAMEVDELASGKHTPNPILKEGVNKVADFHAPSHPTSLVKIDSPPASVEMSIIARQQGLNDRFRIFIDFDITSDRFELIKKWSKRLGNLVELKSSLCITLGCYLLADLKEQSETRRLASFEQLLSCTPSKWPQQRGSLSLKVISAESKEENLPLSPPFQVTPDSLLDISGLVAEGRNQIQLHQTIDLRCFLFVLHAHQPTPQQLEKVQHYVYKTKEWQQFLEKFAAPFAYDSFTSASRS